MLQRPVPSFRQFAVVSVRGGAGKTTMAALLATELARHRADRVLAVDADKVTLEASFADDLDADSLDLVELVMALEDEFDVSIEEEELEGIGTVAQAVDLVRSKL